MSTDVDTGTSRRHRIIVSAVVAAVTVVTLTTVLVSSQGGPSSSPSGAVDGFMNALNQPDVAAMKRYSCPAMHADIDAWAQREYLDWWWRWEVLEEQVQGSLATLTVDFTMAVQGEVTDEVRDLAMVLESGGWRVCGSMWTFF